MSKAIAVVVEAADPRRMAEALRAAVGLTLRGDAVTVVTRGPLPDAPQVARAVATLRALGHRVEAGADPAPVIAAADAVEVWTDPGPPRAVVLAGGRRLVYDDLDAAAVLELVLAADRVVVR